MSARGRGKEEKTAKISITESVFPCGLNKYREHHRQGQRQALWKRTHVGSLARARDSWLLIQG